MYLEQKLLDQVDLRTKQTFARCLKDSEIKLARDQNYMILGIGFLFVFIILVIALIWVLLPEKDNKLYLIQILSSLFLFGVIMFFIIKYIRHI